MTKSLFLLGLLTATFLTCLGCSTNDNPTDADQMSKIRKQEATGRANFNPSTTPPPGGAGR